MKTIFIAIYRFFKFLFLLGLFGILLITGMAVGGFYLLDYVIRGETVEVPDLYGLHRSKAIEVLVKHDLNPKLPVKEVPRDDIEPGIVIEVHPRPGSEVKKRRSITLVVSAWAGKIDVPNLIRQREDEIVAEMRASNLDVGLQAEIHHPEYPKGTIIAQNPLPGQRYVKNRQVDLLISLGPEVQSYIMPDYMNQYYRHVVSDIENKPFNITKENVKFIQTTEAEKWNRVIEQTPPAGAYVQEGDEVNLIVGSSGRTSSELRIEYVQFPMPYVLHPERLSLIVWDESARTFQNPHIFPIYKSNIIQDIELYVPVVGDAFVALGLPEYKSGLLLPNVLIKFDYMTYLPRP